jgi:glycosyltransferase involved in cell wall biosynthesis
MRPLVVVPAYDEAASLPALLAELAATAPRADVLVVDDGSSDETLTLLRGLGARHLRLPAHVGLGSAMRAGLRYAAGGGWDTVVRLDADGQHPPAEIARLLAPLGDGSADAVQGSRYAGIAGYRATGARRLGQRVLSVALSAMTGAPVTDPTSGFWAFGPRAVRLLGRHHPRGYAEPELRLLLHRNGLHVAEVPFAMRERRAGRTSLTVTRTPVALARLLLATALAPLRPVVDVAGD